MNIAVVAAAGRTGRAVVDEAVDRGHRVIAVARRDPFGDEHLAGVEYRQADVTERDQVMPALRDADAVVSAIGIGASREATVAYSQGTANLLEAMRAHGARPLVVVSAAPAGPRDEQPFMDRHVAMPILDRFFGASYADMRRMETLLQSSDQDWVSLRPPRLLERPARGSYRMAANRLPRSGSITIPDLAAALLDCLERPDLYHQALYVSN